MTKQFIRTFQHINKLHIGVATTPRHAQVYKMSPLWVGVARSFAVRLLISPPDAEQIIHPDGFPCEVNGVSADGMMIGRKLHTGDAI